MLCDKEGGNKQKCVIRKRSINCNIGVAVRSRMSNAVIIIVGHFFFFFCMSNLFFSFVLIQTAFYIKSFSFYFHLVVAGGANRVAQGNLFVHANRGESERQWIRGK